MLEWSDLIWLVWLCPAESCRAHFSACSSEAVRSKRQLRVQIKQTWPKESANTKVDKGFTLLHLFLLLNHFILFQFLPKDNWSVLKSSFFLKLSSFAYPTPLLHRACCPQDSAYVQCAKLLAGKLLGSFGHIVLVAPSALVKPQLLMRQVPLSSCINIISRTPKI